MQRALVRLILDVVLTIVGAFLLLGGWFTFLGGGFAEGFRVLFNFMDVGLAIWAVLLIVWSLRGSPRWSSLPRPPQVLLLLLVATILNLLVVITVGFIQGGWAPLLVGFAVEAGIACLVAAAVVVPIMHRLVK